MTSASSGLVAVVHSVILVTDVFSVKVTGVGELLRGNPDSIQTILVGANVGLQERKFLRQVQY